MLAKRLVERYAAQCNKDEYLRSPSDENQNDNFDAVLPMAHADYANEVFKSSYNLGFLRITEPVKELELEKRLVSKIKSFILELGKGFSFIGNQYRLEYNNKEYAVDMLFFHRGLRSLVAIELKLGAFKAEYVGKMNLYLSLLDRLEKGENENPVNRYHSLRRQGPLGCRDCFARYKQADWVAEYQLLLPKDELQALLIQEINSIEESGDVSEE